MDSTCNNQLVPCYGPMNYNGAEEERKEEVEELSHNTSHDDELNKDQLLHSPKSVINPKFDPYASNNTTNMDFQEEQKSPQQQETGGGETVTSSWFWLPENSKENDFPKENQVPLSPKLVMDESDGIPLDVISSQERAWKELHNNTPGGGGSKVTRQPVEIRKSSNPTGSDSIHPKKMAMKEERQMVTAAGVASGALIGGIVAGPAFPLGAILGGAYVGYAANKLHKHGERKAQRRWEKYTFQKGVMGSPINQSDGCVFV